MRKYRPALALILFQSCFAVMVILIKVAFRRGMSPTIFVTYRQLIATLSIAPFAYFLERKTRPPLCLKTVAHIFVIGLLGVPLLQISYFYGLSYTSSTFAVAILNLLPAITFVLAIIIRMEKVNARNTRGQAKIVSTITCVGGATIMTLMKGPTLGFLDFLKKPTPLSRLLDTTPGITPKDNWTLGPILIILAVISYGAWLLYQSWAFKDYPAQASLTAMMLGMGTLQSAILALIMNKSIAWRVNSNFELFTCAYSGILGTGLSFFLLSWSLKEKGPVYTAAFAPLSTVIVAILEPITLRVDLHIGSVVGMVVVFCGLYIVLWGRAKNDNGKQKILPIQIRDECSQNVEETEGEMNVVEMKEVDKIGNKCNIGIAGPTTLQV
ncbi:WAT1-related protein At4g08300 [Amborella trichopoda]|nr:WAT1-related protein At4g08300 [Amborella trichopoda]|eukprot:XP_020530745.1 WAT1-related protein At4g08300 [Amborella trichopoda]